MGHVSRNREKLLNRLRRLRGQLNAVEKLIEEDQPCADVLHTLVACRGAINSLVGELLEDHVRHHVVDPGKRPATEQARAAQELIDVFKSYLRH
jgi:DNA-binding FrmR family transcriptional regulator